MARIRLTDTAWQQRELPRVRAVFTQNLTRTGIEQGKLARLLKRYLGTEYANGELTWFREQLVGEGLIEVV